MKKIIWLLSAAVLFLFASSTLAVDGVVVIPLTGGARSIDYRDVVTLNGYATPSTTPVPLKGGTLSSPSNGSDYIVPANKVLVVTTMHIRPNILTAGTHRYEQLFLYRETAPRPGYQYSLWTFRLQDDGGGENRAYHFSPGLIIPGGDLVTFENSVGNAAGVNVQLNGYLISK